ncbi:hypothetical protein PSN01_03098 [Micromonospora saelicesensis]|nr:hypothetical protein PSN01_03098 [Micromonospora saelicesensis]
MGARGPQRRHQARSQREQQGDGYGQGRPPPVDVDAERHPERRREGQREQTGDEPEQGDLAQDQRRDAANRPAETREHRQLGAPVPDGGADRVAEEEHADHQHQHEEHQALTVHRLGDDRRHAECGPVLGQPQHRPAERAGGQLHGLRRPRRAEGDVHVQPGTCRDLLGDQSDPLGRPLGVAAHVGHPYPDRADRGLGLWPAATLQDFRHTAEVGEEQRRRREVAGGIAAGRQRLTAQRCPAAVVGTLCRRCLVGLQRQLAEVTEPGQPAGIEDTDGPPVAIGGVSARG